VFPKGSSSPGGYSEMGRQLFDQEMTFTLFARWYPGG
jgi:hypothetical protein